MPIFLCEKCKQFEGIRGEKCYIDQNLYCFHSWIKIVEETPKKKSNHI